MFHPGTSRLIGYWSALARGGAPARADFDVVEVAELMPRLFVLERGSEPRFRLVGEFVADLHGRRLKGRDALALFTDPARPLARRSILQAVREATPVVILGAGRSAEAREVALEITVAPLLSRTGAPDRLVGLCQPTSPVAALHGEPVAEIAVRMAVAAEPRPDRARLRLAAVDGRRMA